MMATHDCQAVFPYACFEYRTDKCTIVVLNLQFAIATVYCPSRSIYSRYVSGFCHGTGPSERALKTEVAPVKRQLWELQMNGLNQGTQT